VSKNITKESLALKKIRELKGLSRKEASILVGATHKTIEKMENGRTLMTNEKINLYLSSYGISKSEFADCLDGKTHILEKRLAPKRPKVIENKSLRRMYKKLITKEVKVLISLRKMRGVSQYQASLICGYSRPTVGHIENGRIELPKQRISHILESYGFSMSDFDEQMDSSDVVSDIQDKCISLLRKLSGPSLETALTLLTTINKSS